MGLFGTDGIRGRAGEGPLAPDKVRLLGQAIGYLIKAGTHSFHTPVPDWFTQQHRCPTSNILGKGRVLIGRDTRASGPEIEKQLVLGLTDFGIPAITVGVVPTPGISQLTRRWSCALGVVISASHNPAQDNGIKLLCPEGLKIPDESEQEITSLYEKADFAPNITHSRTRRVAPPKDVSERTGEYLDLLLETIKEALPLEGISVAVDCANGAASPFAARLLETAGASVTVIHDNPTGSNINETCGATHPEIMARQTVSIGANIGAALDGDADRGILADEKGNVVDGDHILAMHAIDMKSREALPGNKLVGTVMSNFGLERAMNQHDIQLIRTSVGDRFVVEEMIKGGYQLGGEPSGHLIFLHAAPAGDGLLTLLQTLALMKRTGKPLSELAACMQRTPQILLNVPVDEKPSLDDVAPVQDALQKSAAEFAGEGRIVLRYSGTEPLCRVMVEGTDAAKVEGVAKHLAEVVQSTLGSHA